MFIFVKSRHCLGNKYSLGQTGSLNIMLCLGLDNFFSVLCKQKVQTTFINRLFHFSSQKCDMFVLRNNNFINIILSLLWEHDRISSLTLNHLYPDSYNLALSLFRWSTSRGVCASGWPWRTAAQCPIRSWAWWWWLTPSRRPPSTRSASTAKCLSPASTWTSRSSTVRTGRGGRPSFSASSGGLMLKLLVTQFQTVSTFMLHTVQAGRKNLSCRSLLFMRKCDPVLPL